LITGLDEGGKTLLLHVQSTPTLDWTPYANAAGASVNDS